MDIRSELDPGITAIETAAGLDILIRVGRQPLQALVLLAWLAGWAYALVEVGRDLFDPAQADGEVFQWLWVGIWAIAGLLVAFRLLQMMFGSEHIRIGATEMRLSRTALGIGRSRALLMTETAALRLATAADRGKGRRGARRGSLAVDYRGQPVLFGAGLKPEQARKVLDKIHSRFPSLVERRTAVDQGTTRLP